MSDEIGPGEGCIICERVQEGARVLFGTHDEPLDDTDSGWQFLCGSDDHAEDGSESGAVACLSSILSSEPQLKMFLDQPIGAALERASEAHVFERIDLPEMTDGEFECSHCQEKHPGLPMDWSVDVPAPYDEEDAAEWTMDERTAVWKTDEESHYFYRAILQLPVVDGPCSFQFSVWVTVSGDNFPAVQHLLEAGAGEEITTPFFGWLSCRLPGYSDTLNLKSQVRFVPGAEAPLLELEPTDHPLAIEQHEGITMARVHELNETSL